MKLAPRQILAAVLLAGLGVAASAQTPPSPPPGGPGGPGGPGMMMHGAHHGGFDPAKMQERRAKRLANLKQKLQLTPGQEGAWSAFAAAMAPPAFQQPDRAQREEFDKLTTPERIDRMRAMRDRHMAEMDKRADATKTFYATLTPEQKKVFDQEATRLHHGRRSRD